MLFANPFRRTPSPRLSRLLLEPLESRLLLSAATPVVDAHPHAEPLSAALVTSASLVASQTLHQASGAAAALQTPVSSPQALQAGAIAAALSDLAQVTDTNIQNVSTPPPGTKQPVITPAEVSTEKAAVAAVQIRPASAPAAPSNPVSVPPTVIAAQPNDQPIDAGATFETALRYQRSPAWQKTFLIGPQPDESITDLVLHYKRLRLTY